MTKRQNGYNIVGNGGEENRGNKEKKGRRKKMTRLTYTLEVKTEDKSEQDLLTRYGFEREWDFDPFSFTSNSLEEVLNTVNLLDEEYFESGWVLTKKV